MSLITSGRTYMFFNAASRTTLDLMAGKRDPGTPVIGYDAHIYDGFQIGKNQQWFAMATDDKASDGSLYFTLRNIMGTTILTLDGDVERTQVVCSPANPGSDTQKWHFIPMSEPNAQVPAYKIASKVGGLCLDIDNGNRTNSAPVIGIAQSDRQSQIWALMAIE